MTFIPFDEPRAISPADAPPEDLAHRTWRRVLHTLIGPRCTAVAEDLGDGPGRYVSTPYVGFDVVERRYSTEEAVARGHARAMLDEHTRRVRGAA
jgi:hypothetical protein